MIHPRPSVIFPPRIDDELPTFPYQSQLQHKENLQRKNTILQGFSDHMDHQQSPSPYPPYYYQHSNSSNCSEISSTNSYPDWTDIPSPQGYNQEPIVKTSGKTFYDESTSPPTKISDKNFSYQQHTFEPPRQRKLSKREYPKNISSSKDGSLIHLPDKNTFPEAIANKKIKLEGAAELKEKVGNKPISLCNVCVDLAVAHMHYGGVCCYSCKVTIVLSFFLTLIISPNIFFKNVVFEKSIFLLFTFPLYLLLLFNVNVLNMYLIFFLSS